MSVHNHNMVIKRKVTQKRLWVQCKNSSESFQTWVSIMKASHCTDHRLLFFPNHNANCFVNLVFLFSNTVRSQNGIFFILGSKSALNFIFSRSPSEIADESQHIVANSSLAQIAMDYTCLTTNLLGWYFGGADAACYYKLPLILFESFTLRLFRLHKQMRLK